MDTSEIAVLTGGVLLIASILWYFFGTSTAPDSTKTNPINTTSHHH